MVIEKRMVMGKGISDFGELFHEKRLTLTHEDSAGWKDLTRFIGLHIIKHDS